MTGDDAVDQVLEALARDEIPRRRRRLSAAEVHLYLRNIRDESGVADEMLRRLDADGLTPAAKVSLVRYAPVIGINFDTRRGYLNDYFS